MSVMEYSSLRILMLKLPHVLVGCALLAGPLYGQTVQGGPVNDQTLERLKQDTDGSMYYVEVAAHTGRVDAIPLLEQKFVRIQDPFQKAKIAEVLVKLGDKNETYWDYLVGVATAAVTSDAPVVGDYDEQGKYKGLSSKFIAWANSHNLSPNNAAQEATYFGPGEVSLLGLSEDRRAIPLLRQAIRSQNYLIEVAAANGLAELKDAASIPLIISACQHASANEAFMIAEPLVYFDDPQAQKTVDTYVPKDLAKSLRDDRAAWKKGPFDYK